MNVPDITFRPITPEDVEFLYTVYASTRTEELAVVDWTEAQTAAFLRVQFNAQRQAYQETYPAGRCRKRMSDQIRLQVIVWLVAAGWGEGLWSQRYQGRGRIVGLPVARGSEDPRRAPNLEIPWVLWTCRPDGVGVGRDFGFQERDGLRPTCFTQIVERKPRALTRERCEFRLQRDPPCLLLLRCRSSYSRHFYDGDGKIPNSEMMKSTHKYGWKLLCGWLPPVDAAALGHIDRRDVLEIEE